MSRQRGFARGDFDTSFPLDDKFLELRARLEPVEYYAAVGVYFTILASAWREADRKPGPRITPDAPSQLDELKAAGLLDSSQTLRIASFRRWVGRALSTRKADTDRKARNRTGMSRRTPSEVSVTPSPSAPRARQGRQGGQDRNLSTEGGVGGAPDDPAETYMLVTGSFPAGRSLAWIDELAETFGARAVSDAIAAVHLEDPSGARLLGRVKARLALDARRLDIAEREAEKARITELRKPTVLRVRPPDATPEEAERAYEEYVATYGSPAGAAARAKAATA